MNIEFMGIIEAMGVILRSLEEESIESSDYWWKLDELEKFDDSFTVPEEAKNAVEIDAYCYRVNKSFPFVQYIDDDPYSDKEPDTDSNYKEAAIMFNYNNKLDFFEPYLLIHNTGWTYDLRDFVRSALRSDLYVYMCRMITVAICPEMYGDYSERIK